MLGAICGEIIGSIYERNNVFTKDFPLFSKKSKFTDDTTLTIAIVDSIFNKKYFAPTLYRYARKYPNVGYGGSFKKWSKSRHPRPYGSWGNGSAMRVSPIGHAYPNIEEVLKIAEKTSSITHNHYDAIEGAQAIAASIFLAKQGKDKEFIKNYVNNNFSYDLESIPRRNKKLDLSAKGTVPQAILAFLESNDYEDAIRISVSFGGDSDTIACMCGGIAEAYYKNIPDQILNKVMEILPAEFKEIILKFYKTYINESPIKLENFYL
ncbi:MAG: ADP-ribosylglycohydrolase family protein [Leptospiraceae bacterium]|nr:ADP-ribosylglycohydrolase family protein [Leptospiraceae bacterium]